MREPTPWERLDGIRYSLDSVLEHAVIWERERIIKLLEEHLGYGDSEWDANVKAIIALIKGEK